MNYESESRQRSSPSDIELQESQRRINANNRFITEEQVNCESETGQRNSASYGELQRFRRQIDANNCFIAKKERKLERMSEEQVQVNPVQYEPQRFQQTIKANNRFIARGGHSYDKLPRAAGDVVVLAEQQGSQVSIDGNNRFIDNIKGNQKDKACQQYGQSDIDDLGNFSDKVINRNIANRYQREQTGQVLDMAGVSWRGGRGQVQQNPVELSSNARGRQAELGKNQGNNQPHLQDFYREHTNELRNGESDRQFFTPQEEQIGGSRKSKAVQVDHVEEQYVIRRNTFSGKNPIHIEDTERPVFVNNYYAGDNTQQMFHGMRESDNSNFRLQPIQTKTTAQDKASQAVDDWDIGLARMHRMEEAHAMVEGYRNNQETPVVVQPNKTQDLTPSMTRSYQIPDYSVPPPNTHTYKSPPDDSLLPGQ